MPVLKTVGEERLAAIQWACKKLKNSVDRQGMNRRGISEALDDKIMGDIATIALCHYFLDLGYGAIAYDQIRNDNFELPDPGWDIVISRPENRSLLNNWGRNKTNDPRIPPYFSLSISVKSSRLPKRDNDDVKESLSTRDFKIFDLNRQNIHQDLTADIETQVYYELGRTQLNGLSIFEQDVLLAKDDRDSCRIIDDKLQIGIRYGECILARWNFSSKIIENCDRRMNERKKVTWSSFGKNMWIAPLREGLSFNDHHKIFSI